jgi:hypothetical protein
MSYAYIFLDLNYLNIEILNYFLFILHVYMFCFCILRATCDYKIYIEFSSNLLIGVIIIFFIFAGFLKQEKILSIVLI